MISVAKSLLEGHKDKLALTSSFEGLQLSHQTVARRVENISIYLEPRLHEDLQLCEYFSLQFDESTTDMSGIVGLCVFIRMVFYDFTVKEEFFILLPLYGQTRGVDRVDIFNPYLKLVKDSKFPLSKLVAITTDRAPSITGKNNGFLSLC
ncbi:zinc finger BED domain-containing protein 5-like [Lycorma delicatula]|uniref:zinc finger BED domain-containing protein 5-like n=1 Tax=Lycorma delicatula TaxID=130591 RepID=UPI003F5115F8